MRNALATVLALGAVAALTVDLLWVWRFTIDDTYITLRYSRHLAEGFGPTFNLTGPRAEGYTSLVWMLVLAVPHLLGVPALGVAKAFGVLSVLGAAALVAAWVHDATPDRRASPLAVAGAVASYAVLGRTAVHAVSGMETALYTCLLTALLYASFRAVRAPARTRYWQLALLSLLVGLSRPEGNLAAGVALLGVAVSVPVDNRPAFLRAAALGWAIPLGACEIFRLAYYGLPFPLPFYVKLASPSVVPGAPPVLAWLGDAGLRIGLPVGVAIAAASRDLRPAVAAAAALVLFLLLPQHLNGYDARYLAPLDPLLSVLFGIGLARVWHWQGATALASATAVALIGLACVVAVARTPASIRARLGYADGMAAAHERLGRELAGLGFRGRLALSDAGAIPYLSEWWTLDLVGLNNAEIAVTGNRQPAHVLASDPDVLVLVSGSGEDFEPVDWNGWEGPLYAAALARGYADVSILRFDVDYWLWVLARPESPAGRGLARLAPHAAR